jgi:choline dehydrogenase
MPETFDFIVVGGGSAGAVIAARLSEDPDCRVVLLEAGERPPDVELMPAACASMQLDPATDWMYTADPGKAGLGLKGRRMPVPRGKMLGGSSSINYMAWVRGHPGDFDAWAEGGATGWSYEDVLPYFCKSEGLVHSDEIVIDPSAHNSTGPIGVSVRSPVLSGAREFVEAAQTIGIPRGDYNGRNRGGAPGVVSLVQTNTRQGKRSSTYRAYLEGETEARPNLTIITGASATRILFENRNGAMEAKGIEYQTTDGRTHSFQARKEVVVSAGAVGSPQLLLLSGVGPKEEIEAIGVPCKVDSPHVGKHLKDHIQVPLFHTAPGVGVSMDEVMLSMGPDAIRQPAGPLPENPLDDSKMSTELKTLKNEAENRLSEWESTGYGLVSSSLYEAAAWFSTGLGDQHSHDAQISFIPCGYNLDLWQSCLNVDPLQYFDDVATRLESSSEAMFVLANPVLPHSEGEITLASADPKIAPDIHMNYFAEDHDMKVMIAVLRRALDLVSHWPAAHEIGTLMVPPKLADKHGYSVGAPLSDAFLEDFALHFSFTVYHLSCTCRIGSVVDSQLRVMDVARLRIADASVMPNIVSGNTNAATIMIAEKAAEMIASDHGVKLARWVAG